MPAPDSWSNERPGNRRVKTWHGIGENWEPTSANTSGYGAVWAKEGSLLSIIELGANRTPRKRPRPDPCVDPRDALPSIEIVIDSSGKPAFEARNASRAPEPLSPRMWSCEGGVLATLVALSTAGFESYVRLWKQGNALIAEQTVRVHAHEPVARFYFRFPSMKDHRLEL